MHRTLFPALLAALILSGACSSPKPVTTHRINEMEPGAPGTVYYYSLPRTVAVVDLAVTQTIKTPGPYARYAMSHLGIEDVIHTASTSYSINHVSISTFNEPDPEQMFFVRLPEEAKDKGFFLSLDEAGMIRSFNKKTEGETEATTWVMTKDYGKLAQEPEFRYLMDSTLKERVDTIVELVPTDTVLVRRQTLRRSWVEKSTELRAREVANHILDLRDKKLDLVSGFQEIPYSSESLAYMYGEMDRLENDYLDLFTGITTTRTLHFRFLHRPEKEDIARRHALFRFSTREGILAKDADAGFPVTISYDRSKATDQLQRAIARHTERSRREMPRGFHHRIPEYADVHLHVGTEKRAEARLLVNQFGIVTHMPVGDRGIGFYPSTGSLRSAGGLKNADE